MDRRTFIATSAIALLAAPLTADAQQAERAVTIGYLGNSSPALESNLVDAFRNGLRQLGYVEGRNLVIKYRWAEGHQERYAVLAKDLADLKPNVIFTAGTPGTLAAKQATQSIPIVSAVMGDPLATGLVSSLAKPGGNVTGFSTLNLELEGKRIELLKQALPKLSRIAVLLNPSNPFNMTAWRQTQRAAEALSVIVQPAEVRGPDEMHAVLATIKAAHSEGLIVMPDRILFAYRATILQFLAKNRLPSMFADTEYAQDGGLMAYGPETTDLYRRSAVLVDKILKGAKPADLPIEQPTKFEFIINVKTAKALGLTIPPSLLLRADQVIE